MAACQVKPRPWPDIRQAYGKKLFAGLKRDDTWAVNIPLLTQFYFNHIFPKVVEGEL